MYGCCLGCRRYIPIRPGLKHTVAAHAAKSGIPCVSSWLTIDAAAMMLNQKRIWESEELWAALGT